MGSDGKSEETPWFSKEPCVRFIFVFRLIHGSLLESLRNTLCRNLLHKTAVQSDTAFPFEPQFLARSLPVLTPSPMSAI